MGSLSSKQSKLITSKSKRKLKSKSADQNTIADNIEDIDDNNTTTDSVPNGQKNRRKGRLERSVKVNSASSEVDATTVAEASTSSQPTSHGKVQKSISFNEKTTTQVKNTAPVYRKKSMCQPLDAKDLIFEAMRSRSGSDKSLRFSDFTKLTRQTTLYEWELAPAEIPLYGIDPVRFTSQL